jgi:hypothetical protein
MVEKKDKYEEGLPTTEEEMSDKPTRTAVITMKVHLAEGGHCRLLGHSRDWNSVLGLEGDFGEYVEWHSHILDAGDEHLVEGFKKQFVWRDGRAFGRNEGVYIAPDSAYGKKEET